MRLVFLDIDGVLNCHETLDESMCGHLHRDKVELLNRVLKLTDARVVLSSAWRYLVHRGEMKLDGLDWLLRSHGMIARRLEGVTREDTRIQIECRDGHRWFPVEAERGQQITEWRTEHGHTDRYVVIDDMDLGIREAEHPFVQTCGMNGLQERHVQELIEILTGVGT